MSASELLLDAGGTLSVRSKVETNGIELAYTEHGEGEPLVLIMGLGADGSAWAPHVEAYAKRYRCIAVDNRGVGASDKPPGSSTTAEMADDYAGLIRALDLGRVRVVGISMGGAIAQELALRHPDLVERLVLVATWARFDAYARDVIAHFARVRAESPVEFMRLMQLWLWAPVYVDEHFAELVEARQLLQLWLWPPGYVNQNRAAVREVQALAVVDIFQPQFAFEAQCHACITHDSLDRLGAIQVPTLVTAGGRDILIRPEFSEELQARVPGAELKIFDGCGHVHHWEKLDEFNRLTMKWLD
jgi:pimeloyl-ACP methyl ester carboxylesterase